MNHNTATRSEAIRMMKAADRIKNPTQRRQQQRAVRGNFCDVFPEWRPGQSLDKKCGTDKNADWTK